MIKKMAKKNFTLIELFNRTLNNFLQKDNLITFLSKYFFRLFLNLIQINQKMMQLTDRYQNLSSDIPPKECFY